MVAAEYPRKNMHKPVEFLFDSNSSSIDAHNQVQNLDAMCSGIAWNANTEAIFALEKIDLPLVDTAIALEAAGGEIISLVNISCKISIMKQLLISTFLCFV